MHRRLMRRIRSVPAFWAAKIRVNGQRVTQYWSVAAGPRPALAACFNAWVMMLVVTLAK